MKKIYFGGGCFWCTEAIFEDVIGVTQVISGYSGGKIKNPSYEQVSNSLTQHAEVCEIIYNSKKINLKDLLKIFFLSHDPTSLNRQGNDVGMHYRSIILYMSNTDSMIIKSYIEKMNHEMFDGEIVTEVKKFEEFYPAEEYHQNYYNKNQYAPYCNLVISPKIKKTRKDLEKYYK
ncbi:MAG: peptide-methionine (S)-S-oxide reductase MsrA [Bacteroidota bacterium]|nr:peptide-methionine (S)-S-oxide reductase MsrA [Bacteroidota bacterium]